LTGVLERPVREQHEYLTLRSGYCVRSGLASRSVFALKRNDRPD